MSSISLVALYMIGSSNKKLESHCTTAALRIYARCSPAEVAALVRGDLPAWLTAGGLKQCFANPATWTPDTSAALAAAAAATVRAVSEALSLTASSSFGSPIAGGASS